jgi:hypothetical protein
MDDRQKAKERSLANLIPPVPGEVRNPKGKPKGTKNRATVLKELLGIKMKKPNPLKEGKVEAMTVERLIELALIKKAMNGDVSAMKLVSEKLYGKIPLDINLGGQQENPVVVDKKVTHLSREELLEIKYGPNWREIFYKSDGVGEEEAPPK